MRSVPAYDGHGRPLVDAVELGRRLGKDRRAVWRLVENHGLPAIRLGSRLAFDLEAVNSWLETQRVGEWPGEDAA